MGFAQLECPLYGVHFSEKGNDLTNTLKIQRIPINLTLTLAKVTTKTVKRTKPRRRIACSGVRLCAETSEKPCFKRFSGIEKVHRNSIKITVDLWSECNYRIWKNPVISMVLAQQVRGFYPKTGFTYK